MIENTRKGILELLIDLVKIPGVSCSPAEADTGRFIHAKLSELPYFRDHPENIRLAPVPDDPFGRGVVLAIAEADPPTPDTVILTGHYDVVDTGDFGPLEHLAFLPVEYTKKLLETGLEGEAGRDLESGDYIFGRGVMDMKCGLAVEMALMAEAVCAPGNQKVNLLFLAVPDEEVNSAGMRAAVPLLVDLHRSRGLRFLGTIMTEPSSAGAPDAKDEVISLGSVGKLMPFFYCVGRRSHVGQYFEGFNASLLAAHCTLLVEGNPDLADRARGETVPPPACLFLRDIRDGYSVTLPDRAAAFFNLLTIEKTPSDIVKEMKAIGEKTMKKAINQVGESAKDLGVSFDGFKPRVLTFEEFSAETASALGIDIKERIRETVRAMDPAMDDRLRSLALITEMLSWAPPAAPMIITGFLPPYYPHRSNGGETAGDRRIRRVAARVSESAERVHGVKMSTREYFQGICDLTYMGFQGSAFDVFCMAANTPGWGSIYRVALKEMMELDVSVMNLGPSGKDPHKPTERLCLSYSLEIFPQLLREAVNAFGDA
ncbi:MAG: M20/M25/M40 family metallo-hydrolase [Thermovirgaceae bacterium]|nr:M20/M25/M40 family metallo-hydrolase [Thermovirgaceae bacterium]